MDKKAKITGLAVMVLTAFFAASLMSSGVVFAGAISESFDVTKYLKLGDQGDRYLKDGATVSPVVLVITDLVDLLAKTIGAVALLVF
ncbi:MAG: hypothetical protein AAB592_05530, partial [Patescibacteria group bacterium]